MVAGGIDRALTARFVAAAKPAVAEVASSRDYRDRYGKERCCRTSVVVVETDGTRLTGGLPDAVRYVPGSTVNVLRRRGPSYRPIRIMPDDEWAVWRGARISLRVSGTFAAVGAVALLMESLLRRRSRAST